MSTPAAAAATPASSVPAGTHANVVPVAALLGTWVGTGRGVYPTISPFEYEEELVFANSGRPFVSYTQRTWLKGSDRSKPMHEEGGFLRFIGGPNPGAKVECLITQCSGVQETLDGSWTVDSAAGSGAGAGSFTISLSSTGLVRSPSARPPFVTEVARRYLIDPSTGQMRVEVDMATEKTPERQNHLRATLTKQA